MRTLLAALLCLAASAAHAADRAAKDPVSAYPTKPIRILITVVPGGGSDVTARAIGQKLTEAWGQQAIVDNRPGGNGVVGMDIAAHATPDGYTIVIGTIGPVAVNPSLYPKLPYDPLKDFEPITRAVSALNVLVVHPSVPARSVKEVIALAKKDPGKWTYASSGNGTSIHMSGAMFTQLTGTDIVHIPYKGSAPAVTDLLGGQTNMMFDNIPSSLPHIKSGKLIALATTGAKRDPALPDLPTIAESGVPGYESGVWFGLMVPAATPKNIIARLNAAALEATKSPEFIKRMTDLGYNIIPGSPEDMARMLEAELKRWAPIVKASGAKID